MLADVGIDVEILEASDGYQTSRFDIESQDAREKGGDRGAHFCFDRSDQQGFFVRGDQYNQLLSVGDQPYMRDRDDKKEKE
jgi:hypothetical protein